VTDLLTFTVPVSKEKPEQLHAALKSILRQDIGTWAAIVVDDAPGDSPYQAIVQSFDEPRFSYVRNHGEHGIGAAWNACVDVAPTELYAIFHADDELMPTYARTMLDLAARYPDGTAYFCGATIIDADGARMFSLADWVKQFIEPRGREMRIAGEDGLTRLLVGNFIMCPTTMYRRSRIGTRRFSRTLRFVLDIEHTTELLLDGAVLYGTRDVCYRYRRHIGGFTMQYAKTGYRFEEEIAFQKNVAARADAARMRRAARAGRAMPLVRLHLVYAAVSDAIGGRWEAGRSKLRHLTRSFQ
jgi:glycosyltransferase involved in cell wall biosynthesis